MPRAGLMVALIASIALHIVFLYILLPSDDRVKHLEPYLAVTWVQIEHHDERKLKKEKNEKTMENKLESEKKYKIIKKIEEKQEKELNFPKKNLQKVKVIQQKQNTSQTIPQNIQAQMLSHVHYPRLARRRAWQGEAELQLYVSSQHIEHVEIIQSTGYSILDKAAVHGLVSMTMITLDDGMYRIPVVFKLQ